MSNKFSNLTDSVAQLKNVYKGPIVDQFNEEVPIYRAAEKGSEAWSGLKVVRNLRVRRNPGIATISDGGSLPSIGRQSNAQAEISAKFSYLRFGITGPMIKSTQSRDGSFVEQAGYELEQGYVDLRSDANRQLNWDGTGTLAQLNAAALATTVITVIGRDGSAELPDKFLDVDTTVDILSTAGVVKATNVVINAISTSGTVSTLTLNQAVTAASTDILVRSGSYNNEVQGLTYSLDGGTGSIYAVSRTTYPIYQGNVTNMAAAQLTLDSMQAIENSAKRRGNGKISAIWTDYDGQRYYQKLLTPDKRYVNTKQGDGGFSDKEKTYLEWNGVAVVPDKDCPPRMFFLDQSTWKKYVLAEMEFADETGTMYIAQTETDALECRIRMFYNLFCERPNANGALRNYISP